MRGASGRDERGSSVYSGSGRSGRLEAATSNEAFCRGVTFGCRLESGSRSLENCQVRTSGVWAWDAAAFLGASSSRDPLIPCQQAAEEREQKYAQRQRRPGVGEIQARYGEKRPENLPGRLFGLPAPHNDQAAAKTEREQGDGQRERRPKRAGKRRQKTSCGHLLTLMKTCSRPYGKLHGASGFQGRVLRM